MKEAKKALKLAQDSLQEKKMGDNIEVVYRPRLMVFKGLINVPISVAYLLHFALPIQYLPICTRLLTGNLDIFTKKSVKRSFYFKTFYLQIQEHLQVLQKQYDDSVAQRESLRERKVLTTLRLKRASVLMSALAEEKVSLSFSASEILS